MITTLTNHRSVIAIQSPPPPVAIDIMLDIETLGTKPGSIILAIGAVRFDAAGIHDSFYAPIHPESCEEVGLKMEASTVCWWFQQSDEARKEAMAGKWSLIDALREFNSWVARNSPSGCPVHMWGNGAGFDNVLLRSAYEASKDSKLTPPWDHWNDRCYRTMKNQFPHVPKPDRWGIHHKADDDAAYQAAHLAAIFRSLKS